MTPLRFAAMSVVFVVPQVAPAVSAQSQSEVLGELQGCLHAVSTHDSEGVAHCRNTDVSQLVGLKRAELVGALGPPTQCMAPGRELTLEAADCHGPHLGYAYTFYWMCDSCIGGGSVLIIQFNSADVVINAVWTLTE
jgi:hypothetical protein